VAIAVTPPMLGASERAPGEGGRRCARERRVPQGAAAERWGPPRGDGDARGRSRRGRRAGRPVPAGRRPAAPAGPVRRPERERPSGNDRGKSRRVCRSHSVVPVPVSPGRVGLPLLPFGLPLLPFGLRCAVRVAVVAVPVGIAVVAVPVGIAVAVVAVSRCRRGCCRCGPGPCGTPHRGPVHAPRPRSGSPRRSYRIRGRGHARPSASRTVPVVRSVIARPGLAAISSAAVPASSRPRPPPGAEPPPPDEPWSPELGERPNRRPPSRSRPWSGRLRIRFRPRPPPDEAAGPPPRLIEGEVRRSVAQRRRGRPGTGRVTDQVPLTRLPAGLPLAPTTRPIPLAPRTGAVMGARGSGPRSTRSGARARSSAGPMTATTPIAAAPSRPRRPPPFRAWPRQGAAEAPREPALEGCLAGARSVAGTANPAASSMTCARMASRPRARAAALPR
jgi:hypothetical protein